MVGHLAGIEPDGRDSQNVRILRHLEQAPLTATEAWSELGIMRLAARVHDLRNAGHAIDCETVTVQNRFEEDCRVARYSFHPEFDNQPAANKESIMSDNITNQGAAIIVASDNINQRQAIAVAVTKGLNDAGFTNVTITVDKSDDPSRVDITPENAETLLGSMRLLNPQLFAEPISILASSAGEAAIQLVSDIVEDMLDDVSQENSTKVYSVDQIADVFENIPGVAVERTSAV